MQNTNAYVETDKAEKLPTDQEAAQQWELILASGRQLLYRKAYWMLGNGADAEDAVQDALLAAYTHLNQFRGQSKISTWLMSILLNCARIQLRRRKRHGHMCVDERTDELQTVSVSKALADHQPNPEDQFRQSELNTRLAQFSKQLSPRLRRTFQLRDVDGLSIRETARILGVPTGTVKAQSARARQRLKELMWRISRPQSRRLPTRSLRFANSASRPQVLR